MRLDTGELSISGGRDSVDGELGEARISPVRNWVAGQDAFETGYDLASAF